MRNQVRNQRRGAVIRRRAGLGSVLLLALVAAALTGCCSDGDASDGAGSASTSSTTADPRPVPEGPNVLLVLLDDLDALTMPYWDAMPKTEARLADQGMTFSNAFVSSPECYPSRATVLTGDYPHNTQVYDSTEPDGGYAAFVENGTEEDTLATRLGAAGYHTSFVGKYLNGYEEEAALVPPGWDDWFGVGKGFSDGFDYEVNVDGDTQQFGDAPEDYLTDVLSDRVQVTLDQREAEDERPFFLALWPTAPHDDIDAAERHADHPYRDADLPRRENYDEEDVSDKPTWLRTGIRPMTAWDEADATRRYRQMMGTLYAVDDLLDDALAKLEADGELEDTLVVFTSDNGYNFGAHRLPHKMAPYEESIRIPLVIAGPGVRTGTDDHLVLTNDLAPTILELAGLPNEDRDGRSLVPLLAGEDAAWRDDFLIEYHGTYHQLNSVNTLDDVRKAAVQRADIPADERPLAFVPTYRAVRTTSQLYVEWYAGDEHEYELYDLTEDPYQLTNLLATPEGAAQHASATAALQTRLEERHLLGAHLPGVSRGPTSATTGGPWAARGRGSLR